DSLKDVQYLFLTVFNKKKTLSYIKNKYDTSYLGPKYICYLAYYDNKPVAFYGAIPQKFTSHSSSILVAHACDSFTLNEFQKKGLHYNLAVKSYELMKALGIKMVYAYHSENTYFSTKKLGWLEHKRIQRFHFKIPTLPLAKGIKKLRLEKPYQKICSAYLKKYRNLNYNNISSDKYKQEYNNNFIQYKNSFNDHYFLQLNNCNFWIKIDAVLHVGFFTSDSDENLKKAIRKLKKIAFLYRNKRNFISSFNRF
ncbi:MAG: GNAT family N-acetyltransferase, partial [Flavobacterium sp.]|nr:GNAT family N-acetyltransferase [Flavobacterium sp.]